MIFSGKYAKYNLGAGHPFSPLRMKMTLELLEALGEKPEYEEPEAVPPEKLFSIHDKEYVEIVEKVSAGEEAPNTEKYGLGTADNPVVEGMAEGARYICGGTLLGARKILEGKSDVVLQLGGGLHHAHRNSAAGFCLYNDLALAIKEFTDNGLYVAYIDIDVHHGDGVQEIFYDDEKVMTISFHETGEYLFPGTGSIFELGKGAGKNLKLNVPLEPFTEGESFLEALKKVVQTALAQFHPDVLVIQAGADAHFSDPLADLLLTTQDYRKIFETLLELGNNFAKGKMLFTLGGGYSFEAAARIWTILYLVLKNRHPEENIALPRKWIERWNEILQTQLPEFLHDLPNPYKEIVRKKEIEAHNRDTVRRLLDFITAGLFFF